MHFSLASGIFDRVERLTWSWRLLLKHAMSEVLFSSPLFLFAGNTRAKIPLGNRGKTVPQDLRNDISLYVTRWGLISFLSFDI